MIRRATTADVPAFGPIINDAAELGLMLHRPLSYLYERVRDFHVAVDDEADEVVGVCGLGVVWSNLAEVYALAVKPSQRGRGVGQQLVRACVDEAKRIGVRRVMALTYEQRFFERLDFSVVDRMTLPLKVWSQCVRCAKNQACDEIAVIYEHDDVPDLSPAAPPPPGGYDVPVPVTTSAPPTGARTKMDEADD